MSQLTGNKDADFIVLMQLNDYELGQVCQANKYVNSLCKDEIFWFNRIYKNIQDSVIEKYDVYSKFVKGLTKTTNKKKYIEVAKIFYGFQSNMEFYKFLKSVTEKYPKVYFYVFLYSLGQKKLLDVIYEINKDELPEWINYEEFIFHLRRKILESTLDHIYKNFAVMDIYYPFKDEISGFDKRSAQLKIPDREFIKSLMPEQKKDEFGLPVFR